MNGAMITVVATLRAQAGKETELAEACKELARQVREKEEGCLMYIAHQSVEEPGKIVFFEKYRDVDAQKTHRHTPYFREAGLRFQALLAAPIEVQVLSELV